jgi:hypothetical protein
MKQKNNIPKTIRVGKQIKHPTHNESWYWFCFAVFQAEMDNLNIPSQL